MGIQLNGWTKGVGPLNIKSHNDFNILYTATKNTITEVANKSKNINDDVTRLKEDIDKLKRIMSSTDFNKKNADLITAIDESISVLDEKQKKLYTSIAERYDRAAETDSWFSDKADEYSGYIREKLLGEAPKSNIGSGVDNSSNARAIVDDSKVDNSQSTNTPGTTSNDTATAEALGLTPSELDVVKAVIRHEAGNNPAEILNVCSCIRNRMTSGAWAGGNNAYDIVTAPKQFSSYGGGYYSQYTNGNYYQGDAAQAAALDEQMNQILLGTIPPTHSYERFRGKNNEAPGRLSLIHI